ncbi:MAG TPA: tetratricopeptide repeat protein [Bryobacteraceae bacterium]|nr:tetratricopeptide repeat protein [Bryobacteraceae bacterium]
MRAFCFLIAILVWAPADAALTPIAIDYPENESIFPAEITPPTFLWRDRAATIWRIDVTFGGRALAIHVTSKGERLRIGMIDPDCIADTNELPKLTPRQAAAHTWMPDRVTWAAIKDHSVTAAAIVTITGYRSAEFGEPVSRGSVTIHTSRDPVGAPIFYRDVPLMPSELERGVIKPLAAEAIPLVAWRLRNIAEPSSRVVLDNLPVCANCHSFSAGGKTLGMDLDGLQNNRGLYILAPVTANLSVRGRDLIQWSTANGALRGSARAGFMSQVSPDGQFVVTTIDPLQAAGARNAPSNYYVANFKDYRFLQVFYPTRGILDWYSKASGILKPLPGADNPDFVQMGGVWSPDGRYLVFARAAARDPNPAGAQPAQFAGDPNETPIQYDLYRILFNGGKGGRPEPVGGASRNGMSNSFPKVSPDGRWIVFVESRNGLLMRPDSQLFIVPAGGGAARRMQCNTPRMNSWHSFSPNGRWMVFSSKSRSPYTQMYLTHIDENGNDSPPVLIDNATAANRAVNLPEFVNIAPDGLQSIGGPALDYYKLVNRAAYLEKHGQLTESVAMWRKALQLSPQDALAHSSLGRLLLLTGHREEAGAHLDQAAELRLRAALADHGAASYHDLGRFLLMKDRLAEATSCLQKAVQLDPLSAPAHCDLGIAWMRTDRMEQSLAELRKAIELDPRYAAAYYNLGLALDRKGEASTAVSEWRHALAIDPEYPEAHDHLGDALYSQGKIAEAVAHWRNGTNSLPILLKTAWVLATYPDPSIRNGHGALVLAVRAVQFSGGKDAAVWDTLAAAYAATGRFGDAVLTAERAWKLATRDHHEELAKAIRNRLNLYEAKTPFRDAAMPGQTFPGAGVDRF